MAKLQNLQKIKGENVYSDFSASTVYEVAQDALDVAIATGQTVTMAFNAARVKVTGKEASSQEVADAYFAESKRRWQEYAASPAGQKQVALEAKQRQREQAIIDKLIDKKLDDAITHGIAGVVGWLGEYANHADNRHLKRRYDEILPKLNAAGYYANAHVGEDKNMTDLRTNGLYIIGQCITCMEGGMPPYPHKAAAYIANYNEMKKHAFIPVMHPVTFNGNAGVIPPKTVPVLKTIKLKVPQ